MSTAANRVFDEALSLPVEGRLGLVEKLLASLNLPSGASFDEAWAEEAERRVEQIEKGEAALIPAEEVFARLRRKRGR